MRIEELSGLGIPEAFIQKFKQEGIKRLYPPQLKAIQEGLFKRRNLVVASPTASGKTLIASLAIIDGISQKGGKVVYIVPLVALAYEKYNYFKSFLRGRRKVAVSCGDLDSADPWLLDYDLIICTTEKLDSLLRHSAPWVKDLNLIIADEIHLLNDLSRGPTLEVLLTCLRRICPQVGIIALSATVRNAHELSQWLEAEVVSSDFRPVRLYEGIYLDSRISFEEKRGYRLDDLGVEEAIATNTLKLKKQVLYFVSTRRSTESLAQRLSWRLKGGLGEDNRRQLDGLAQKVLGILETPTRQCRKLAECIKGGVAFHHAGLLSGQKRLIEDNFRGGLIKGIVATPTLALGVNLPAFRVVVRDVRRYYPGRGSQFIPVLEYKQFAGRAGRPQYDTFGESILIAHSKGEAQELIEQYIKGVPEKINSKLASSSALRMHTLSLIASEFILSKEALFEFLSHTFFGFQYRDVLLMEDRVADILDDLQRWGFLVQKGNNLKATRIGKRVSQLYLDPQSAHHFIECLKVAHDKEPENFSFLQLISSSLEMQPLISLKKDDLTFLEETLARREDLFLSQVPLYWEEGFDGFLRTVKMALALEVWTEEATEEFLLDRFQITPGELHNKLELSDWLIYCLGQLCVLLGLRGLLVDLKRLRTRLKFGVKEELLDLIRLKEIGRVRARRLYEAGLTGVKQLRKASLKSLSSILGPKIAHIVWEQLQGSSK